MPHDPAHPHRLPRFRRASAPWSALTALVLLAGLGFRLVWLGDPFVRTHHWNEGHYACSTLNFARYGFTDQRNDLGRDRSFSPCVPLLLYPTARAAGWQPWGFRLPLALLGVGALAVFSSLARRRWGLSAPAALGALAVAASAPGIVYYARNVQLDGVATALLLTALWLVSSRRRAARRWGWLAWAACVMAKTSFAAAAPAVILARASARPGDWRRWRSWMAAGALAALGVVPVAAWQAVGGVRDPGASTEFLFRFKEWSLATMGRALRETPDFFLRDFGWVGLALAGLGAMAIFMQYGFSALRTPRSALQNSAIRISLRRLAAPLAFSVFWMVFIVTHPAAYSANRYYIYPALWGLATLAGWGCQALAGLAGRRFSTAALVLLCAGIMGWHGWLYGDNYGKVRLKGPAAAALHEGEDPFENLAALRGAALPRPLLVDYPSAMFYAGGDPARVVCAYGDVAAAFDPARHGAVALNFFEAGGKGERALVARLKSLGWREAAPRLWCDPALAVKQP